MKTLLAGIAIAATIGIVSGKAMQPDLDLGPHPTGPQMAAREDLGRIPGLFEEIPQIAAYKGALPDYVLGTDLKAQAAAYQTAEVEPEPRFVTYSYQEPADPEPEPSFVPEGSDAPAEAFAPADAPEIAQPPAEG